MRTIGDILQKTPKYLSGDFEIEIQDYLNDNEVTYVEINFDFVEIQTEDDYKQFYYKDYIDIRALAEELGLDYIETTTARNGYPQDIKPALIGFKTFSQAQEIADTYNLSIESFESKDGWHLWTRNNRTMYEPYNNSAEDYGDNYNDLWKMDEEEFYEAEVEPALENFDNLTDLKNFIKEKEEIFEEMEKMDDEEIIITHEGRYYETIKKESMNWSHDTKHHIIGLI